MDAQSAFDRPVAPVNGSPFVNTTRSSWSQSTNHHCSALKRRRWTSISMLIPTVLTLCIVIAGLFGSVSCSDPRSTYLLFANRKDIRLINAENPRANATVIYNPVEEAAAVDFYYEDEIIFWTDIGLEMIRAIKLNGSKSVYNVITTDIMSPDGLACDWLTKKLYWADSNTNRIEVSQFDGRNRKVLFWDDLDQPRAVALVPQRGYIYWSDWGEVSKIERASMDGRKGSRRIVVSENIVWPNGLTVDYGAERVYWADAKLGIIDSMDYDGKNRRTVVKGNLPHPFALTLSGDLLFWTDWSAHSISVANKTNGQKRRTIIPNGLVPMDIHVYSAERQPYHKTGCQVNNGGCSHLCLLSDNDAGFSCGCPTGLKLLEDGEHCADRAEKFLLLARRVDIRIISLDTDDYTDVLLPIKGIKHNIAIDYADEQIYWTDDEARLIRRAFINGTGQEDLIVNEVHHPDGIAVDWIAKNLYWTDTGTDRIEVARLNGTSRKILITDELDEPRTIALHPVAGLMFWTDWGAKPKIERAWLDGSNRQVIVNTSLGWPNGLAIDFDTSRIYWCDAKTDKIEYASFSGTERHVLISDQLPHSFGFTILDDWAYWTDWQRRSVERVNKNTGQQREILIDQLPDLMGLKAIRSSGKPGTNPCANDNGQCSHLCLNRPNDYICACPMGYELATDYRSCVVPEAFVLFARQHEIKRISLQSKHLDTIPVSGIESLSAFDYDKERSRIYWTDTSKRVINGAFMNGSSASMIVEFGLEDPEGMAVDWLANHIYWTDSAAKRIEMARVDGSFRKVLIWKDIDRPKSIVLNPGEGTMYWSDWGLKPRIERTALDATRRTTVFKGSKADALTINYENKRLYWIDTELRSLESTDLNGNDKIRILGPNLPSPHSITLFQDYLYWTDWDTSQIERVSAKNEYDRSILKEDIEHVVDIKIFHSSRQIGWNPCAVNNGGCSHLCFAVPPTQKGYQIRCACPTHYTLTDKEGVNCTHPTNFMLYNQKQHLIRIVISPNDVPDAIIPLSSVKNAKALAYDPLENYVFWIDPRTHSIRKVHETGNKTFIIVPNPNNLYMPHDLVADPYARVIFWSCSITNSINVTRFDGRSIGPIVGGSTDKPRALALYARKDFLFWVNSISPPVIVRMTRDGFDRKNIIEHGLEDPAALAIDPTENALYWSDAALKRIESSDLSGKYRRVIVQSSTIQPVSLAVYGPHLYWIDRDTKYIERADKLNGMQRQSVFTKLSVTTADITVVEPMDTTTLALSCKNHNGGCTHLCLPQFDGARRKCACPQGLILSGDDKTCVNPPTCSPDQFACHSGKVNCILESWRCDGTPECEDQSDELHCPECPSPNYRCSTNMACLKNTTICDGNIDCPGGADEECCSSDEFSCGIDKGCIRAEHVCDGKADCRNGQDEEHDRCYQKDPVTNLHIDTAQSDTLYQTILSFFALVMVVCVLAGLCFYRKKNVAYSDDFGGANDVLMAQSHLSQERRDSLMNTMRSTSSLGRRFPVGPGAARTPSELYDRNNVTGASSTSSSSAHPYPKETLNPPPSPVTDQSCHYETLSQPRSSRSNLLSKKHYYHKKSYFKHRAPHSTPCPSDFNDDSDSCAYRNYYANPAEVSYDFEPFPPPPTPRMYFSDASTPPSPATERSYHPYVPPSSPVLESDEDEQR